MIECSCKKNDVNQINNSKTQVNSSWCIIEENDFTPKDIPVDFMSVNFLVENNSKDILRDDLNNQNQFYSTCEQIPFLTNEIKNNDIKINKKNDFIWNVLSQFELILDKYIDQRVNVIRFCLSLINDNYDNIFNDFSLSIQKLTIENEMDMSFNIIKSLMSVVLNLYIKDYSMINDFSVDLLRNMYLEVKERFVNEKSKIKTLGNLNLNNLYKNVEIYFSELKDIEILKRSEFDVSNAVLMCKKWLLLFHHLRIRTILAFWPKIGPRVPCA